MFGSSSAPRLALPLMLLTGSAPAVPSSQCSSGYQASDGEQHHQFWEGVSEADLSPFEIGLIGQGPAELGGTVSYSRHRGNRDDSHSSWQRRR
jgi:hypothetical protein